MPGTALPILHSLLVSEVGSHCMDGSVQSRLAVEQIWWVEEHHREGRQQRGEWEGGRRKGGGMRGDRSKW